MLLYLSLKPRLAHFYLLRQISRSTIFIRILTQGSFFRPFYPVCAKTFQKKIFFSQFLSGCGSGIYWYFQGPDRPPIPHRYNMVHLVYGLKFCAKTGDDNKNLGCACASRPGLWRPLDSTVVLFHARPFNPYGHFPSTGSPLKVAETKRSTRVPFFQ